MSTEDIVTILRRKYATMMSNQPLKISMALKKFNQFSFEFLKQFLEREPAFINAVIKLSLRN